MLKIVEIFIRSECGNRKHNEDYTYPAEEKAQISNRLFVICDGVGGRGFGDVASQLVCDLVKKADIEMSEISLSDLIESAQRAIAKKVRQRPEIAKMATTIALLDLRNSSVKVVHLGDSRVYHLRGERVLFQTIDHSLVEEYRQRFPNEVVNIKKNVITKALSAKAENMQGYKVEELPRVENGDLFFLCTDGVLEGIPERELLEILQQTQLSIAEKGQQIMQQCARFSQDNYTFQLLKIEKN